jgi:hypothetical protein
MNAPRQCAIALGIGAGLAFASPARAASFVDYSNVCAVGSFVTCASLQISTVALAGGGTQLDIRIRNLHGTDPRADRGTHVFDFMAFGSLTRRLRDPFNGPPSGPTQIAIGPVHGSPDPIDNGWEDEPFEEHQFFPFVAGCALDPSWDLTRFPGGWQTCDSLGFTGWVVYRFDLGNVVDASDIYLNLGVDGGQVGCSVGPGGYAIKCLPDVTTVPEPSTVALMLTGLVGVAAVRRIRARRP